jgi:hypothetical protein
MLAYFRNIRIAAGERFELVNRGSLVYGEIGGIRELIFVSARRPPTIIVEVRAIDAQGAPFTQLGWGSGRLPKAISL